MIKHNRSNKNAAKGFSFALLAGILIITNGLLLGVVARWFIDIMPTLPGSSGNDPTLLIELATLGVIFGGLIVLGALMLRFRPLKKKTWGIMIILFSIPSVIMGGGFIIGFILGIIGGRNALSKGADKPVVFNGS
jgi:hypothetical protein